MLQQICDDQFSGRDFIMQSHLTHNLFFYFQSVFGIKDYYLCNPANESPRQGLHGHTCQSPADKINRKRHCPTRFEKLITRLAQTQWTEFDRQIQTRQTVDRFFHTHSFDTHTHPFHCTLAHTHYTHISSFVFHTHYISAHTQHTQGHHVGHLAAHSLLKRQHHAP